MRHKISLLMRQAEMKSRMKRKKKQKPAIPLNQLQRRIAATILIHSKGYGPREIALHFNLPENLVSNWIEAGKPLLF